MKSKVQVATAVQVKLLRRSLRNSARTEPLLAAAMATVAWLGWTSGLPGWAAIFGALTLAAATGQLLIRRHCEAGVGIDLATDVRRTRIALEGVAALAALAWVIGTLAIYPELTGPSAAIYVALVFGSIAAAALFMPLVGHTFAILAGPLLAALAGVSVAIESVQSIPMAVLCAIFGAIILRAAKAHRATAMRWLRHGIEADRKAAIENRAKDAAEDANLAKTQFLAKMSHELRTPMNGILGALDLLRHSSLDATQRRLVDTATSSGQSLMGTFSDVLDHAKAETGQITLQRAPMELPSVATSVIEFFHANAEAKGLWLKDQLSGDVPAWVFGDSHRLKQVLLNLVGNAIKYTERGGVSLSIAAQPIDTLKTKVTFAVQDSGIGIEPSAIEHLFLPFHHVKDERQDRHGSTGLGLAISQHFVEAMGGKIVVESLPGMGSRFSFAIEMELDPAEPPTLGLDSAVGDLDSPPEMKGTVLVVEDNPVNLLIAIEMLQSLGVDVLVAENGVQALEQIGHHAVDLIFMDCDLPVTDGYTITQRIRANERSHGRPRVPVVALTADAQDDGWARARSAGMDAYLTKPYTRSQLRDILVAWLRVGERGAHEIIDQVISFR